MIVDFTHSLLDIRSYDNWKTRADEATVAFAPFGGGPYYGYEVGVIDAMNEIGLIPDAILPGCVGNFIGLYNLMALVENKPPTTYIDEFSSHGLMREKDYLKAPIPPLFPLRIGAWMNGLKQYYSKPEAYSNLLAPELFSDVLSAWSRLIRNPNERNLGAWTRNLLVWNPMTRLVLGGYFFAPIGPFGELYDHSDPEGWISPAINWGSVYEQDGPIYMMSLLQVGADDVTIATNCMDHPTFVPVDGRRLASASNLPWLIAETEINGVWHRESSVRSTATLSAEALDSLPNLETLIAVQIMAAPQTNVLSINQGNHDNYSLQVTEMIGTIGDEDIKRARAHLNRQGRGVELIIIQATSVSKPHWTFENMEMCRKDGYRAAMDAFRASKTLSSRFEKKSIPDLALTAVTATPRPALAALSPRPAPQRPTEPGRKTHEKSAINAAAKSRPRGARAA